MLPCARGSERPPGNGVRPRMKDEPRVPIRHQLDHAVPTVIHNPDEDLPVLARWLRHAMDNPTRFWSSIVGLVIVVVLIALLSNGLSLGGASSDKAWTELETADSPAKQVEIAEDFPNAPASRWALLQAAAEYYNRGFADLPNNKDAAATSLARAIELYERVEKESPADSPQARAAAFGAARALEARNKLERAIEQYKRVARTWPGTDEAKQAKQLAELLEKPESVAFYKELYESRPTEVTLPPFSNMTVPAGHPPIDGLPPVFPSLPLPNISQKAAETEATEFPDQPFAPTSGKDASTKK